VIVVVVSLGYTVTVTVETYLTLSTPCTTAFALVLYAVANGMPALGVKLMPYGTATELDLAAGLDTAGWLESPRSG
jgi:hypothetical protein